MIEGKITSIKNHRNLNVEIEIPNKQFDYINFRDKTLSIDIVGFIYGITGYDDDVSPELIEKLYREEGIIFVNRLRGSFAGAIKHNEEIYIFTDHTSSIPIYYHTDGMNTSFSDKLMNLSTTIKLKNQILDINNFAIISLLTYGYMINDNTVFNSIRKLVPGSYFNNSPLSINQYYKIDNSKNIVKMDTYRIIDKFDKIFNNIIEMINNKSKGKIILTLSGGLDSRMVLLKTLNINSSIKTITFANENSLDHKISQQISKDYKLDHLFVPLSNGDYLRDIQSSIDISGNLTAYHNSAHLLYCLKQIQTNDSVLLTGIIGDGVLGSLLELDHHTSPNIMKKMNSRKLIGYIEKKVKEEYSRFDNHELAILYNRCFNGTYNGFWVGNNSLPTLSPFIDPVFMDIIFSISPKMRYKNELYRLWIKNKLPEMNNYLWAQTGRLPLEKTSKNNRVTGLIDKIKGRQKRLSMNPFDKWYHNNESLKVIFNRIYKESNQILEKFAIDKSILERYYENGTFNEKAALITLIYSLKFNKGCNNDGI